MYKLLILGQLNRHLAGNLSSNLACAQGTRRHAPSTRAADLLVRVSVSDGACVRCSEASKVGSLARRQGSSTVRSRRLA